MSALLVTCLLSWIRPPQEWRRQWSSSSHRIGSNRRPHCEKSTAWFPPLASCFTGGVHVHPHSKHRAEDCDKLTSPSMRRHSIPSAEDWSFPSLSCPPIIRKLSRHDRWSIPSSNVPPSRSYGIYSSSSSACNIIVLTRILAEGDVMALVLCFEREDCFELSHVWTRSLSFSSYRAIRIVVSVGKLLISMPDRLWIVILYSLEQQFPKLLLRNEALDL